MGAGSLAPRSLRTSGGRALGSGDFTGRSKQRKAYGDSGAKAERNLPKTLLAEIESAGDSIAGNANLAAQSTVWKTDADLANNCSEQTIERYSDSLENHILPALWEYRLMEVTVSRVYRFLRNSAESTPGLAKSVRTAPNGMFRLGVRCNAIRWNPVRDESPPAKKKQPVQAFTVDGIAALCEVLQKWQDGTGHRRLSLGSELLDVVDLMRSSRSTGSEGFSSHVFLKSVVTLIDAEATLEAAAAVLGHSGTAVTSKHYVAKTSAAPDMSSVLNQFGQNQNEKDG